MGGDPSVKLVLDCHTDLGESPVWDARTGRLYFVDINEKQIHVYTPSDKSHFTITAPVSFQLRLWSPSPELLPAAGNVNSNVKAAHIS